eukprot:GEZU01042547.1.p1 GENE.GEZU01042547.1~~GEZU01042547.1.p1  ORF type:complete len:145 (-),score=65.12 GEZU01042547.1:221-655(-)
MVKITSDMKEDFKICFKLYGNGTEIPAEKLGLVMRACGQNPSEATVAAMLEKYDPEVSEKINFDDFVKIMEETYKETNEDELLSVFKVFDKQGTKMVAAAELRNALVNLGEKMNDEDADYLISQLDVDADGNINCEEFVRLICS